MTTLVSESSGDYGDYGSQTIFFLPPSGQGPDYWKNYYITHNEDEETKDNSPYMIKGPRSTWILVRNQNDPSLLFSVGQGSISAHIKSFIWFKEVKNSLNQVQIHPLH